MSAAADKKNVFAYAMAYVNESTSESYNIIVDSIKDFYESPHTINNKAHYSFTIEIGSSNKYSARLRFQTP